jgi:hypothetical protein
MSTNDSLLERLNQHPLIKARVERLLTIVENPSGESNLADDAEDQVIESLREFGGELLQEWAETRNSQASVQLEKRVGSASKNQKKSALADNFRTSRSTGTNILPA